MIGRSAFVIALAATAGCFSPRPPAGSPCDAEHPCPVSQVCRVDTCELPGTPFDAAAPPDVSVADGPVIPGCVATGPEICGDGIDQDCVGGDLSCEANDKPAGAIDITAGGTFTPDFAAATDDLASTGCDGSGGRDVFYQVSLTAPQLYYFDTFGADLDTSVRVFGGVACSGVTGAMSPLACSNDACSSAQSQVVAALPGGSSCVVLDQAVAQVPGKAKLRVVPGGTTADPLPRGQSTQRGDTCTGLDRNHSPDCKEAGAKDISYWFTACPGETPTLDATTCNQSTKYDTVMAVRVAGGAELVCSDDGDDTGLSCPNSDDGSVVQDLEAPGPALYLLVVDGFEARCGTFQLDSNLR